MDGDTSLGGLWELSFDGLLSNVYLSSLGLVMFGGTRDLENMRYGGW